MEDAELDRKVRKAVKLLLLQRPRAVGVKGWELRRALGKDYQDVLGLLNTRLDPLGLEVKSSKEEGEDRPEEARYFLVMKESPTITEALLSGWRIDELAMLAAAASYIVSKGGKVQKRELMELLGSKFGKWRVEMGLEKLIRRGYLRSDEGGVVLGWRSRVELDLQSLLRLVLLAEPAKEPKGGQGEGEETTKVRASNGQEPLS